ncbi:MAG: hypothetical protein AVDCRST_MAG20-1985 [uncultured Acidimicrobiales bacterium]|uniref:Uncharacterized protein n=1 Tax=uncultured Acidimicrobiales bacterium TaxID=310071 RepID=A0A6J4IC58_9ACTN|nr:MAG: hypothetical protein AVDCRST_MAG20-1985 [uncultured Acidimicrobiales bacterium]
MASFLNKVTRFANSPEGRRAIGGLTNRGTGAPTGRARGGRRATPTAGGSGGTLGRLAGGLLGGRRR